MIQTIISIITSALVSLGILSLAPIAQPQDPILGSSTTTQFTGHLLPIGTSTLQYSIGTTSESGDRRYRHLQSDYATTVSVDVYDDLKIGRSATTTITEGTITTTDLTVTGTCTGCSGTSADLQDAYNASGDDAQITTANTKDIIFFLQDTATDPNFVINIDADSQGQLRVENSVSGAATTTPFSVNAFGSTNIGIGTGTPAGLTVASTSIFQRGVWSYGTIVAPSFNATSTTNPSLFAGDIGSSVARVPNGYFTNLDVMTILVNGYTVSDLVVAGDLYVNGGQLALGTGSATSTLDATATSTWQGGLVVGNTAGKGGLQVVSGGINIAGDSLFSGVLRGSSVSTSTLAGGLTSVGLLSSSGLTLTGGHILSSGRLEITSTATSTLAGSLAVAGSTSLTKAVTQPACQTVSFASAMTIDWALANCFALGEPTSNFRVDFVQIPSAFQNITLEIYNSNINWQPLWGTSSTSPTRIIWMNRTSTSTPWVLQNGLNRCQFTATSSPNAVEGLCSGGGKF